MVNMELSKDELAFLEAALEIALGDENEEDYVIAFEALLNRVDQARRSV